MQHFFFGCCSLLFVLTLTGHRKDQYADDLLELNDQGKVAQDDDDDDEYVFRLPTRQRRFSVGTCAILHN